MDEILSEVELALVKALVAAVPAVGRFLIGLASGEPAAVRRVGDILPEQSASESAAVELRGQRL